MPIYEYSCNNCGHRFEVIQKFNDAPIAKCEQCSGSVAKVISPPGLSFKGSGWYITDYSSKSKPPPTDGAGEKPAGDTRKTNKSKSTDGASEGTRSGSSSGKTEATATTSTSSSS